MPTEEVPGFQFSSSLPAMSSELSSSFLDNPIPEEEEEDDIGLLQRGWLNERSSPELLPYLHDIIANVLEVIRRQQQFIDTIGYNGRGSGEDDVFMGIYYELEVERIKFLIRSYIETRLQKVALYRKPVHIYIYIYIYIYVYM
jgi:hypothetical protein